MSATDQNIFMRIDSHHHFWRYNPDEYGWIGEPMKAIRRDFLPEHLRTEIDAVGIDGVVSVQARQKIEETEWLLEIARRHDFIKGVVGWLPIVSEEFPSTLETFASNPLLKGIRHVLQDEPDANYMLRDDFNRGIDLLRSYDIAYDILIFERHLPQTIRFVDRHPDQIFVLDHVAKPRIRDGIISPWRERMIELAKRENVYCKISGMVTEADHRNWSEDDLIPYLDVALEAFGPKRLMFGSDWPVCLVACDYRRWYEIVSRFTSNLSEHERMRVFGETAAEAYRL